MPDLIQKKRDIVNSVNMKNRVLIAAHRGSAGGNIILNTIQAFIAAERQGADIVEIDISRTIDGELLVYHDGAEHYFFGTRKNIQTLTRGEALQLRYRNPIGSKTIQRVQTLEEVLVALKGDILITIDRGWGYVREILKTVKKLDMADQIIVKGPVLDSFLKALNTYGPEIMVIPIIENLKDIEKSLSYDLNFLGIELVFSSKEDEHVQLETREYLKKLGLLLWGNAIQLNERDKLADKFDDVVSIIESPDKGWGKLLAMGFNIIQTDWPWALQAYLQSKGYAVKEQYFFKEQR